MRGVGVAVTLAGSVFLPAIGMGTGAAWGAAGIQGAPREQEPFFLFLFPLFGSVNVQTLLVQEDPNPSHTEGYPSLVHKGFPSSPSIAQLR